uniref:hypothetical protein n=1 Tax=Ensifer adhaerens TaxID=106592 RepID=UPI003F492CDA
MSDERADRESPEEVLDGYEALRAGFPRQHDRSDDAHDDGRDPLNERRRTQLCRRLQGAC